MKRILQLILFYLVIFQNTLISSQAATIIVSDLDDTIKQSNVSNTFQLIYNHLKGPKPFNYLLHFFRSLDRQASLKNKDIHFYYLTSTPSFLGVNSWLEENMAPKGIIQQKPCSRLFQDSYEYKYDFLKEYLKKTSNKKSEVYLFGDNGEQDAKVYSQIIKEFKEKVKIIRAYIRRVKEADDYQNITYFSSEYDLLNEHIFKNIISPEVKQELIYAKKNGLLIPSYIRKD